MAINRAEVKKTKPRAIHHHNPPGTKLRKKIFLHTLTKRHP